MTKSAVSYLHMYVRTGDKRQDRLRDPASWLPLAAGKSLRNRASVCFLMFVVEPMFGCLPRRRSGAAGLSMNDAVLAHVGVSQKSRESLLERGGELLCVVYSTLPASLLNVGRGEFRFHNRTAAGSILWPWSSPQLPTRSERTERQFLILRVLLLRVPFFIFSSASLLFCAKSE